MIHHSLNDFIKQNDEAALTSSTQQILTIALLPIKMLESMGIDNLYQ